MRCRDIERFVTGYVDGDLDNARASAMRGHVRSCADCAAIVAAEALVREAVGDLDPVIDPPAALWERIQAHIADAEVADSERSRVWLWWQRSQSHVAFGAAAIAVAALAVVWMSRDGVESTPRPPVAIESTDALPAEPAVTIEQQFSDEIVRADERYQKTIHELLEIAAGDRDAWSRGAADTFDERWVELASAVNRERASASGDRSPTSHDALFAAYRTQISFLHGEVVR